MVVVILFAPKRCFRQCGFLLPAAFQAANTSVTLGALARKGKVFGTSHVISDHFMLVCAVIASSEFFDQISKMLFWCAIEAVWRYAETVLTRL